MSGFDLSDQPIFLGARADLASDRHFNGRLALLKVYSSPRDASGVACVFTEDEMQLPGYGCRDQITSGLDVSLPLIGTTADDVEGGPTVNLFNNAEVTSGGISFDGDMSYGTVIVGDIENYASDGGFSISFWVTKTECTDGLYEYVYSQHHDTEGPTMWTNSFIDMYIGCETSGGGFSTITGSIMRFNLKDADGNTALFDYPLHDAGNFDAITNRWIHFILTVTGTGSLAVYVDGIAVDNSEFGTYNGTSDDNMVLNFDGTVNLNKANFGSFDLDTPVYLGARADLDSSRLFSGRMALLKIYDEPIQASGAECIFAEDEPRLPGYECRAAVSDGLVEFYPFLVDAHDAVEGGIDAELYGSAKVTSAGLQFDDGAGSYATIGPTNNNVVNNGTFSISYWFAKQDCTSGPYEYLFSQSHDASANILLAANSNINMFIECAAENTGVSILRTVMLDISGQLATFDYPLHDAGDFDAITNKWVHVVVAVSDAGAVSMYVDGLSVDNTELSTFQPTGNLVSDSKGTIALSNATLKGFDLTTAAFVGARTDLNADRHFAGQLALFRLYSRALTATEIACLFAGDEPHLLAKLPTRTTTTTTTTATSAPETDPNTKTAVPITTTARGGGSPTPPSPTPSGPTPPAPTPKQDTTKTSTLPAPTPKQDTTKTSTTSPRGGGRSVAKHNGGKKSGGIAAVVVVVLLVVIAIGGFAAYKFRMVKRDNGGAYESGTTMMNAVFNTGDDEDDDALLDPEANDVDDDDALLVGDDSDVAVG
jgi:hypothetical protein